MISIYSPTFNGERFGLEPKKQRLVDSVLRDWHVPPIHVIEHIQTRNQEVLDGQQRLAAIRDFVDGEFTLDGEIEPLDDGLARLHGCKYRDLPDEWKRRFNQFTIRLFRIVDYRPSEPGELFFRLNQPTSLTGAEQRNAFFGPVCAECSPRGLFKCTRPRPLTQKLSALSTAPRPSLGDSGITDGATRRGKTLRSAPHWPPA